jgi:hypothetical protein
MQFPFFVIIFVVIVGLLLWYLTGSAYFSPRTVTGDIDVWNVMLFISLLSIGFGLLIMLLIFVVEKLFIYGKRENPPLTRIFRVGIAVSVLTAIILMLHIFHFLNFMVAIVMCLLVVVGIIILAR